MKSVVTPEIRTVMDAVHYRPAVSILLPFEHQFNLQHTLHHRLKTAADQVERELSQQYPADLSAMVMERLRHSITNLQPETRQKSVAIYVSPVFEKVLYLDIAVEPKIIIDEAFEIRDLLFSKKQLLSYLVVLLSAKEWKMFLGGSSAWIHLPSPVASTIDAYVNDAPEKVGNFSDPKDWKEVMTEKFLRHIDEGIDQILHSYPLPIFVVGAERVVGHFKQLTKHGASIVDSLHGNYEEATQQELKVLLRPRVEAWKKARTQGILEKLDVAAGQKKLAIGMKEVWKDASHRNGRLLVVENNFMYAAGHGSKEDVIFQADAKTPVLSTTKDAVDEVLVKVLENGGDIEFVEPGALDHFQHIALVRFY